MKALRGSKAGPSTASQLERRAGICNAGRTRPVLGSSSAAHPYLRKALPNAHHRRQPGQPAALAIREGALSAPAEVGLLPATQTPIYRFIVPQYVTRFGEHLRVVGSIPALGCWELMTSPQMVWHEGHKWVLETRLEAVKEFEFKVVAVLGHEVRWEQGINRVVQADEGDLDLPVELVINLTCSFDLTHDTGMELVLDRTSIQETYELATATLELLQKRRSRLVRTLQETTTQGPAVAEQQAEAARLDAAVSSQARSIEELSSLVSSAKLSEDGQALLLAMPGPKIEVPKEVGLLVKPPHTNIALALGDPGYTASVAALPEVMETTSDVQAYVEEVEDQWVSSSSAAASYLSSDSEDLEPDDAAAAMAAAAYASLSPTKKGKKKKARRAEAVEPVRHASPADAVASAFATEFATPATAQPEVTEPLPADPIAAVAAAVAAAEAAARAASPSTPALTASVQPAPVATAAVKMPAPVAAAASTDATQAAQAPAQPTPSAVEVPAQVVVAASTEAVQAAQVAAAAAMQARSMVTATSDVIATAEQVVAAANTVVATAVAAPAAAANVPVNAAAAAAPTAAAPVAAAAAAAPVAAAVSMTEAAAAPAMDMSAVLAVAALEAAACDADSDEPCVPLLTAAERAAIASLPLPTQDAGGALFFSSDLLAAIKLPPTPSRALASPPARTSPARAADPAVLASAAAAVQAPPPTAPVPAPAQAEAAAPLPGLQHAAAAGAGGVLSHAVNGAGAGGPAASKGASDNQLMGEWREAQARVLTPTGTEQATQPASTNGASAQIAVLEPAAVAAEEDVNEQAAEAAAAHTPGEEEKSSGVLSQFWSWLKP